MTEALVLPAAVASGAGGADVGAVPAVVAGLAPQDVQEKRRP